MSKSTNCDGQAMKPLDLKEFAEDMRRKGDIRNTDRAARAPEETEIVSYDL